MAYGVTAYRVKWEYVDKYIFGSKDKSILRCMNMHTNWHIELTELFRGTKSITPKKAAEEIVNGVFSRSDFKSGAMYRYVFEKMLYKGTLLYFKKGSKLPREEESDLMGIGPNKFLHLSKRMDSHDFYPIELESVKALFNDFKEIPLPFPSQEDFPLTSFISYENLLALKVDFTSLCLPDNCKEEFNKWINDAIQYKHGIVLFYC